MTQSEIAEIVRRTCQKQFNVSDIQDGHSLWDDLGADDLDYLELALALEEEIPNIELFMLSNDSLRDSTVGTLIEHVSLALDRFKEV
jgi:acyl carrier protein